ncbi:MAG: hypothetical protein NUV80_02495 [Candidatus Berkelbacteria bacterium]|nr:hypothetical protein [Candidatus Berkelbacteria bacterium]
MNYQTLQETANRRGKISDATSKAGVASDLNIGQQIVSSLRFWPELMDTDTISVTSADGSVYSLADDVDDIEQILITSPVGNEAELPHRSKVESRRFDPVRSNSGTGTPIWWDWSEPSVTQGVETKKIQIYPNPDQAYTLTYSYRKRVSDMSDNTSQPFFNPKFHHILIDYALWKEAETNPEASKNPNYWEEKWQGPLFPQLIGGGLGQLLAFTPQGGTKEPLTIPGPDRL